MRVDKKQPQSSARKKTSASSTSPRAKKAASKASKSVAKIKVTKKKDNEDERLRKRVELTLRAFRMAYEANQRGEFQRL